MAICFSTSIWISKSMNYLCWFWKGDGKRQVEGIFFEFFILIGSGIFFLEEYLSVCRIRVSVVLCFYYLAPYGFNAVHSLITGEVLRIGVAKDFGFGKISRHLIFHRVPIIPSYTSFIPLIKYESLLKNFFSGDVGCNVFQCDVF